MTHTPIQHTHMVPIPEITADPRTHVEALKLLKEGYETLTRQRGDLGNWAVTFTDLVELGVITEAQANEHVAKRRGL